MKKPQQTRYLDLIILRPEGGFEFPQSFFFFFSFVIYINSFFFLFAVSSHPLPRGFIIPVIFLSLERAVYDQDSKMMLQIEKKKSQKYLIFLYFDVSFRIRL